MTDAKVYNDIIKKLGMPPITGNEKSGDADHNR